MHNHKVGIDLMGSDASPDDLLKAVVAFAQTTPSFQPVIFATSQVLSQLSCPFEAVEADSSIAMGDDPIQAIQNKQNSSMCLGLQALKEQKIAAFVSAGNTGALLVGSKTILDSLPGIDRPALLTLLPTQKKAVAVLDVGANTLIKPKHFLQFAVMGIAYQKSLGVQDPKVGLLNIGKEASKGTPQLQEAYEQLESLNHTRQIFIGNIESREVFKGEVEVLVTDGFSGNIFLKTAEGVASFILSELEKNPHEAVRQAVENLNYRLHYTDYPGAILCGVDGLAIKCHGDASPNALINTIKGALSLIEHNFLTTLKDHLELLV